ECSDAEMATRIARVDDLQTYLVSPGEAIASRIVDRAGYAQNLKSRIHKACLSAVADGEDDSRETLALRSLESVATQLERIAELCREGVKQIALMSRDKYLEPDVYGPMLDRVRRGLELVEPAIKDNDTQLALTIGRIEDKLDRDFDKRFSHYVDALSQKKHTEDLIRALFLAHTIEQMGDTLLAISEAIISANLGQVMNMDGFFSLRASMRNFDGADDVDDLRMETIAETRSGSAISTISGADGEDETVAIFKDGLKKKLKEERQGMESWHEIYPGLAPKILAYKKHGESASLLIEHLPGYTFEHILLNESQELLHETMEALADTLKSVWRETRSKKGQSADFMGQLQSRISEAYRIHPEFQRPDSDICGLSVAGFDTLVNEAKALEKSLETPFSVYIHGDFNLDNIIYDPMDRRLNFIDLHRSRYLDYVQDVSVFMVSAYRLQILDTQLRQRIMATAIDFHAFARRFARKQGDAGFELRLALGLARSFATSTRFILDKSLARRMFLRARYLLELVLAADPRKPADFQLPIEEIFVA
ncbi:MAG: phosphotransferase, partial [Gammaproteobacteria bacterium]